MKKKEVNDYQGKDPGFDIERGGIGRISLRNLKTFESFKNPVYRLYYGSILGQMMSMNMQMLARTLLIYRLTGSATLLGVMSLVNAIPMIGLSLFGGVIADRIQKKYVILFGDLGSALGALMIAIPLTLGYLSKENPASWWIIYASSLIQGTIMGLMMPSRQAIIPEIVGEEQLMNAVSLNVMGMNTLRLFAPALTGFLIDGFDFAAVFYVMTVMYLVAALFAALLPHTGLTTIRGGGALADIKEGLRYIRNERAVLFILLFSLFAVVLAMPYMMLLPIFTEDIFKVGAKGMGILMSVSGIGAIIASVTLASLPDKKRGLMLLLSSLVLGLALAGFAFSGSWYPALAMIIFVGLGQSARMTLGNTLLQYYTADEYRGRVMSISMMEFGLSSLGTFGAALLAEALGVQWAIGGFAIVLVLVSALALVFLPRIRRLD